MNSIVNVCASPKCTEFINCDRTPCSDRDSVSLNSQRAIVFLDLLYDLLQSAAKGYALGTEYQIVQTLTVVRIDDESRADIFIDEGIVEDGHIWDIPVPSIVLESRGRGSTVAIDHDMGRISRAQPVSFGDRQRIVSGERAEYRRQRGLAASVLRVSKRQARKLNSGRSGDRVKLANISE